MELSPQQIEAARLEADIAHLVAAQRFTPAQRRRMRVPNLPRQSPLSPTVSVDSPNRRKPEEGPQGPSATTGAGEGGATTNL